MHAQPSECPMRARSLWRRVRPLLLVASLLLLCSACREALDIVLRVNGLAAMSDTGSFVAVRPR